MSAPSGGEIPASESKQVRRLLSRTSRHARDSISYVRHLQIAWALVRFYFRLTPAQWYRRFPFLPVPPRNYIQWRLRTAYGKDQPSIREVIQDLWRLGDWLREFPE